jgi:hypothetical protein
MVHKPNTSISSQISGGSFSGSSDLSSLSSDSSRSLSLTDIRSERSVEAVTTPEFQAERDAIQNGPTELEVLVTKAKHLIENLKSQSLPHVLEYGQNKLRLDLVLLAMLANAHECGGEHGTRYIASAILACDKDDNNRQLLLDLAITWFTHLLFLCES